MTNMSSTFIYLPPFLSANRVAATRAIIICQSQIESGVADGLSWNVVSIAAGWSDKLHLTCGANSRYRLASRG